MSSQDGLFGPQLLGRFDFTLLFEQAMLSIVPGGITVLAIPFYLRLALSAPPRVRPGFLLLFKLVLGLALLAVHTTSLILWKRASIFYSELSVPAAIMSLVSSGCILIILYVAHIYSLRTSGFLSVFLSITILFDITMTRSYFRRDGLGTIGALQIAVVALKSFLVVLEEIPKRTLFRSVAQRASASAEITSGFWNRSVFGWLNSLLVFGFKNDLKLDDLPPIGEDFNSLQQYDLFVPNWNRVNKSSSFALIQALLLTVIWEAVQVIIPRLLFVGINFAQPFLLFDVIRAVNGELDDEISRSLVLATALIFVGKAITRAIYEHLIYRIMTRSRAILVVAIYCKLHKLPLEELEGSAAVTLMTSSTAGIEQMLSLFYEIWSCALQVGLGVWSLNLYVGPACYLLLVPGLVSFIASHYIGLGMIKAREAWNKEMESRVASTSTILAQIKSIKSMGLSEKMAEHLQEQRREEIRISLQERNARIWMFAFASLGHVLPPIIVIAGALFWTRVSNPLDVAEIFAIVAIIIVAASPYYTLLQSIIHWSSGLAAIRRTQEFLCTEEVQDSRQIPDALPAIPGHTPGEKDSSTWSEPRPTPFAIRFNLVAVTSLVMGPILKEVTFCIPWGNLAILWGPIASGKSTLLRCILGETKLESGTVTVGTKSIGYCNQESWIRNQTLRDNITGVLAYVETWYHEVVVACGLDVDIVAMVNGDQAMTGTGGCNLSGGQKQRVSLARSVYEQPDVLVIDDVFSALDPETARLVFDNLFGREGLVRRWNCTVVLTTNQLEFLDDADQILQLHKGGRVEQQEVELSDGSSASGSEHAAGEGHAEMDNEGVVANDNESDAAGDDTTPPTVQTSDPPSVKPSTNNFELQHAREKRKYGDWSLYRYYLGAAGTFTVIFWLCATALCATVEQFPNIFIRIWYSQDAKNPRYFIGFVGFGILNLTLNSVFGAFYFYRIVPQCSEEMHLRLTNTVMFASSQYLSQTDAGSLLNRFSQDILLTSQYLPIILMQFLYTFFTVVAEIGIIASGSGYTAPVMISLAVLLYLIQHFYLRTSRQLRLLELESVADLHTYYTETSTGVQLVRAFQWQKKFTQQLGILLDITQRPYYYLFCCQRWLHCVLDFVAAAAALILVAFSVSRPEGVSSGGLALSLLNIIGFNLTASFLIYAWTNLETGLGAVSRVKSFCHDTPQEKDTLSGPELEVQWPRRGRLDFNCVSAHYLTEDGSVQRALDTVTFTVFPGEKVAISGRTGSGKSSLLATILRMTDFTGSVSIDGRNSRSVSREFLRSRITTLTQNGVELQGSVRFNLYPYSGPQPDEDQVTSTLTSIGLLNHINSHGGLEKPMSSMGFSVSQKQLLFLARGILHHLTQSTSIVIIDEATSAMDNDTDDTLQDLLDSTLTDCTILQIAHREETFRNIDVHVRLDLGHLAQFERTAHAHAG